MRQQRFRRSEESNRVRQLRVQLKRGLVRPFRMNRERKGLANRLKYPDSDATALGSTGLDNPQKLLAKFHRPPRPWFKVN